ncbi:hypothetical protein GCM10023187_06180 [Nibrella viscosa]|uniref:LysM domain-containing protein n=1 Tax=Nibrella viscosa TaxID=1084524 RepID=A0ABP8JWM0_9BACT
MKKQITHVTFGLLLACLPVADALQARDLPTVPVVLDSIGIERVNNRLFVKHKVTAGQTLYAIARRYNTTPDAIKAANPAMADNVRTDQILRIPYTGPSVAGQEPKAAQPAQTNAVAKTGTPQPAKNTGIHTVGPSETLYAVASNYKVLMADIRRWNKLTSDQLEPGQQLIVSEKAYKASMPPAAVATAAVAADPKPQPVQPPSQQPVQQPVQAAASTAAASTAAASTAAAATKAGNPELSKNAGVHTVEPLETLYMIATVHKVLMSDIRRWNKLTSDQLEPGQQLIISETAYKASLAAAPKPAPVSQPVAALPTKPEPAKVESEPARPEPTQMPAPKADIAKAETDSPTTVKTESTRIDRLVIPPAEAIRPAPEPRPIRAGDSAPIPTTTTSRKRVSEIGLAELIDDDSSNKYLALHRTAPVGSLVQVRNDVNNQVVWVKIIGKLPDTGVNDRIIIKLSARAFEKLSPHDRRFRAEVNYLAQ